MTDEVLQQALEALFSVLGIKEGNLTASIKDGAVEARIEVLATQEPTIPKPGVGRSQGIRTQGQI